MLIIDDCLQTGSTMKAAEDLVNSIPGACVTGTFTIFEILGFSGSKKLNQKHVSAIKIETLAIPVEKKPVRSKVYNMKNVHPLPDNDLIFRKVSVQSNNPH